MEKDFSDLLSVFSSVTSKPETFLEVQDGVAERLKRATKQLYDLTKRVECTKTSDALSELIIQQFDDEQIWQEIELQNEPTITDQVSRVSRVTASTDLKFNKKRKLNKKPSSKRKIKRNDDDDALDGGELSSEEEEEMEGIDPEDDNSDDDEYLGEDRNDPLRIHSDDDEDLSEDEKQMVEMLKRAQADIQNLPQDDDDDGDSPVNDNFDLNTKLLSLSSSENNTGKKDQKGKSSVKKRKTIVDDEFFKMADMEEFLDQEDMREDRKISGEADDVDSSDEQIDYFADVPSEEESEEVGDLTYKDFFDMPDDDQPTVSSIKKVKFNDQLEAEFEGGFEDEEEMEAAEEESEGEDAEDIVGGARTELSTYEKRQEKVKKKILSLEEAALADKPWQLSGEVGSAVRPENSLLEQNLEYEHTSRLPPLITEETTKTLEDIIKQRIKDKVWDDVERKVKPVDDVFEYKKKIVLDDEKSKMSLGQIYEQEYIKQQQKEEEEKVDPNHEQIKKMMTSLFVKLDALSNFHYTPRLAAPEVKIVSNLPSINMEEVAPTSVSDAMMLAPGEIQTKPKREVKGDTEKSSTDRKRQRRIKKNRQGTYFKDKEIKQKALEKRGLGKKYATQKALKDIKSQSRTAKGIRVIEDDKKNKNKLTSSTQFFNQLQDEVTTHVQAKKHAAKKQAKKLTESAAKYKL